MKNLCKITSCENDTKAKDMCSKHYYQVSKYGKTIKTKYDKRPALIENGYAKLPLGVNAKDGYAIIDKENAYLDKYNWRLNETGYVVATINKKVVRLHRLILDTGKTIDHANRDKLDNRIENLRPCTYSQNHANKIKQSNNTSGYKGVYRHRDKWRAKVVKNGKQYHAGTYGTAKQAAKAYDRLARKLFGEFSKLNIEGGY